MNIFKKKDINVWFAVNKDGSLSMHVEKPEKNEILNIWVSKYPFCNSIVYNELSNMITKTKMNWDSEPQFITINNG